MLGLQSHLTKWDDEVRLNILPPFKYNIEYRSYELGPNRQREDGGLEFEIILNRKPTTNVFYLDIETRGLRYHYQPKLYDRNVRQPENGIGSYAVYHESASGDYSRMGGKNYMTGKAFHIFRPQAVDAKERRAWASLRIDLTERKLIVTVPQEFLDNAAYPVIIDPDFGYTSIGVGERGQSGGSINGNLRACSAAGTATSVSLHCAWNEAAGNMAYGIYDSQVTPVLVGNTGNVALAEAYGWRAANISYGGTLAAASYWLVLNSSSSSFYYHFDTLENACYQKPTVTFGTWPTPLTSFVSDLNDGISIFCSYDTGGASITPAPDFIAGESSQIAPAISGSAVDAPDFIAATGNQLTPVLFGSAVNVPAFIAALGSQLDPAVTIIGPPVGAYVSPTIIMGW